MSLLITCGNTRGTGDYCENPTACWTCALCLTHCTCDVPNITPPGQEKMPGEIVIDRFLVRLKRIEEKLDLLIGQRPTKPKFKA